MKTPQTYESRKKELFTQAQFNLRTTRYMLRTLAGKTNAIHATAAVTRITMILEIMQNEFAFSMLGAMHTQLWPTNRLVIASFKHTTDSEKALYHMHIAATAASAWLQESLSAEEPPAASGIAP